MTLEQILITMQNAECDVSISYDGSYYGAKKWAVRLTKETSEVSCSIRVTNELVIEAVRDTWQKYQRAVKHGIPELMPAISHQPED